ncbi:heterogeneous nuclear ribonucleoprotein D-like isoform X1 [Haliotis asinina]|uniref:heterogeneous nuclear ribonucleoprotein D-like isoform X1 n=1 Tax=Haliotis asinina TaxID=109174 RepID=UPI0035325C63
MAEGDAYGQTDYSNFDGQNGNEFEENSGAYVQEKMEGQETTEDAGSGDDESKDDGNEDARKIFVGGLSWETTSKDLKDYFTKFGEVVSCTLKTDLETKRSRGFGFVVFKDVECLEKALQEQEHKLHGRNIDPKKANPRAKANKIFVGRLDPVVKEEDIKSYFSKFGEVAKLDLPYDKIKEQRRAFCFVEFETEEGLKNCLETNKHKIGDQEVDIKRATPTAGRGRGGRGGYGGGWGQGWHQAYNQNYNNYNNYYGSGYGSGYGGYGGYGGYQGYDYNQGYGPWGGYDQYGGYGGYGGYDYGGWGYNQDQGQQSNYGKAPKRGGGGYHPYNRS